MDQNIGNLKGSKTEQNLLKAFAGESQVRNKYTFFAKAARKEGYQEIADFFDIYADNEMEHAKIWFKFLNAGVVKSTVDNLKEAADGEHSEWDSMYKEFAQTAKEEGFDEIAEKFLLTAKVEKSHEGKFNKFLNEISNGSSFSKNSDTVWVCKNCGFIHFGKDAPEECPLCEHGKGYFKVKN